MNNFIDLKIYFGVLFLKFNFLFKKNKGREELLTKK